MARSVTDIYNQTVANYVSAAASAGILIEPAKWSMYNYQRLLIFAVCLGWAVMEQLWDAFKAVIEALIAAASPQTGAWFQAQMFKFQFDALIPQILQFDTINFAPYYVTVDTTKQVIKYCAVVPGVFGTTLVKVAAQVGGFPGDLDTAFPGALAAANSYVQLLSVPGITLVVQSGNSDKLYVDATIYYQGLYSAVIQVDVIAAIQAYFAAIPFNGVVLLSDLEAGIKAVPGVNDVVFNNVQARADATAYGSGTDLVIGGTEVARKWATVAGYIVGETTSTHTLTDSLTFISE